MHSTNWWCHGNISERNYHKGKWRTCQLDGQTIKAFFKRNHEFMCGDRRCLTSNNCPMNHRITAVAISLQKLEAQLKDIVYGTKQYKIQPAEMVWFFVWRSDLSKYFKHGKLNLGPSKSRALSVIWSGFYVPFYQDRGKGKKRPFDILFLHCNIDWCDLAPTLLSMGSILRYANFSQIDWFSLDRTTYHCRQSEQHLSTPCAQYL